MALTIEVRVNGTADTTGRYITWAPSPCQMRVTNADGGVSPITVRLRNKPGSRGRLVFRTRPDTGAVNELSVNLNPNGQPTTFFVAGDFGEPSREDGDAVMEVRRGNVPVMTVPMMVRIRKDAETLTTAERNRFLSALARLNNRGDGLFKDFRATHLFDTSMEAHGDAGFMPWHRAYMLDLERELQRIDPSVSLPYWRFDRPAPKLFTQAFIGAPADATGFARLAPTNPLRLWMTDGIPGISRDPVFDVATSGAFVSAEAVTVQSSVPYGQLRGTFEINPHGNAHTSFSGWISSIGTAAKDPLFFLLHCNVDRLWAKWQWFQRRFDATKKTHYEFTGSATSPGAARIGHNALDTMWPWNNVTGGLRPNTAPRKPFPSIPTATAPAAKPTVGAMVDFQGRGDAGRRLGFDYDDVPYEPVF